MTKLGVAVLPDLIRSGLVGRTGIGSDQDGPCLQEHEVDTGIALRGRVEPDDVVRCAFFDVEGAHDRDDPTVDVGVNDRG